MSERKLRPCALCRRESVGLLGWYVPAGLIDEGHKLPLCELCSTGLKDHRGLGSGPHITFRCKRTQLSKDAQSKLALLRLTNRDGEGVTRAGLGAIHKSGYAIVVTDEERVSQSEGPL